MGHATTQEGIASSGHATHSIDITTRRPAASRIAAAGPIADQRGQLRLHL
jgi:hypothetical protein